MTESAQKPKALFVDDDKFLLGLYLVKNVVEKHSGKAWFASETEGENKGTTFFVEVPGV